MSRSESEPFFDDDDDGEDWYDDLRAQIPTTEPERMQWRSDLNLLVPKSRVWDAIALALTFGIKAEVVAEVGQNIYINHRLYKVSRGQVVLRCLTYSKARFREFEDGYSLRYQ